MTQCEICGANGIVTEATVTTREIHRDGYRVLDDVQHDYCEQCVGEVSSYAPEPADVAAVEYYDELPDAPARRTYRDGMSEVSDATQAEMDRIDQGLKALCLS